MKKYIFTDKKLLIGSVCFSILVTLSDIGIAFIIKTILDLGSNGTIKELKNVVIFSLMFVAVTYVISYIGRKFQALYIKKIMVKLRGDIIEKILEKNMSNYFEKNSAEYISIITNDLKVLESSYFNNIIEIISNFFRLIVSAIAIIYLNKYISICIFIIVGISIYLPVLFSKKISYCKKEYSDKYSANTVKIKDILDGFEVIKGFNIKNKIVKEYNIYNEDYEVSNYKYKIITGISTIFSNFLGFALFFTSLTVGIYLVINKLFTVGSLVAVTQLMNNIKFPIINISNILNEIKGNKFIIEKINCILNYEESNEERIEKLDFYKDIEFKNVSFSYSNQDKNVLENISFRIEKNKKYAIVGPSGSGKSTILKLILGYYDNYSGKIYIDGIDIKEINKECFYKLISNIQQNVYLFNLNIEENIKLFNDYNEEDFEKAIKDAGLENFLINLGSDVKCTLGENGNIISGGEKQRISIARALIKHTQMLLLDEATSSLDNVTAYNIENTILSIENVTAVLITHKLTEELLNKYDYIIFLDKGKICDVGKFKELFDKKGEFYRFYSLIQYNDCDEVLD